MRIYLATVPDRYDEELYQAYCRKVDPERLAKVRRIKAEQSRMGSLLAGCLLQWAIKEWLAAQAEETGSQRPAQAASWFERVRIGPMISPPLTLNYRYGQFGKPALADYQDFHYNLSHSGHYAVCGVDDEAIGVDIQEEIAVSDDLGERFFTAGEADFLRSLPNEPIKRREFFRLWSVKESYIKLTGQGMHQGLNSFEIDWEKKRIVDLDDRRMRKQAAWFEAEEIEKGVHLAVCGYVR